MQVYTFGNAASHFNNPLRTLTGPDNTTTMDARDAIDGLLVPGKAGQTNKPKVNQVLPKRVIPYIEHYCNSEDMVNRWGALYSAKQILQNRFCAHIFISDGSSGHMLNQHYLGKMFPVAGPHDTIVDGVTENDNYCGREVAFLDHVVKLDTATVTQRKQHAAHQLAIMRHESALQDYDNHSHVSHKASVQNVHTTHNKADHGKDNEE